MESPEYYIWLQCAFGPGSPKPGALLRKFPDIMSLYNAGEEDCFAAGLSPKDSEKLLDKSLAKSEKIIEKCLQHGYKIITIGDNDYPSCLRDIYSPPCVLYVWGELPDPREHLMISIVGTRQITDYGYETATKLAMGLARCGAVVVSGLAVGVDAASHKGALKADGKTVAVIGCGLDIDYPSQHTELRRLISKNGAVISEFPPGSRPDRINFPIRNRIIAGLSVGTVVIEAGLKSGSLITASLAAESGRDVFAVPGSILSPMSEGANRLIRDGAKPVCCTMDILEEYIDLYPQRIILNSGFDETINGLLESENDAASSKQAHERAAKAPPHENRFPPVKKPKAHPAGLSEKQEKVYRVLGDAPTHVDELALKANLELKVVLAVLTSLEIMGLAKSYPGRRYTLI